MMMDIGFILVTVMTVTLYIEYNVIRLNMDTLIAFAIVAVFKTFCIYVQLTFDRRLPWRKMR